MGLKFPAPLISFIFRLRTVFLMWGGGGGGRPGLARAPNDPPPGGGGVLKSNSLFLSPRGLSPPAPPDPPPLCQVSSGNSFRAVQTPVAQGGHWPLPVFWGGATRGILRGATPPSCTSTRRLQVHFGLVSACVVALPVLPHNSTHGCGGRADKHRTKGIPPQVEGKGPQRWPHKRLDRRSEEVAKAVGGGYCRLQMPSKLALAVRETVAGHRLGALEGGGRGGYLLPFQCIAALPPSPVLQPLRRTPYGIRGNTPDPVFVVGQDKVYRRKGPLLVHNLSPPPPSSTASPCP